jgi:Protein of unknown function (DUF2488).
MADIKAKCPQPAVAIISTNKQVVIWLKLRLEYVFQGQFQAPTPSIPDALKSLATVA